MSIVMEETNRLYLGEITLGVVQAANPPSSSSGPGVLENLYEIKIPLGSTLDQAETRRVRFKKIEVVLQLPATTTQAAVVARKSRKNPAPYDYSPVVDSDPDTWGSAGAQEAFNPPGLAGGDTFEITLNGSKWFQLYLLSQTGTGEIKAKLYGLAYERTI